MKIQFKLKDPKSPNPTSIQCFFYHQNKRFVYSLGDDRKIFSELWDDELQRPIKGKTKEDKAKIQAVQNRYPKSDITTEISNIESRIDNLIQEINTFSKNKEFNKQPLILDELKDYLNGVFRIRPEEKIIQKQLDLNEYIEAFVEGLISGERTYLTSSGDRKQYAPKTVVAYKAFAKFFRSYQKDMNRRLNFDDITNSFYTDFVNYLTAQNYKTNTIGNKIKYLKTILSSSQNEGLHSNTTFKNRDFKKLKTEVFNIFLTHEELNRLYNLDLSETPHFDLARDLFLCGCYTALRYSDYSRLSKQNIITMDDKTCLQIITQKTSQKVIIPIRPELDLILKKYDYNLPVSYEQKINKYIKEIGKLAGIDEIIEFFETKGAKRTNIKVHKYEKITTHTGRRTGATLLYMADTIPLDIMKITGHKTEKSLLTYIKVSEEETASRLLNSPFFSGSI